MVLSTVICLFVIANDLSQPTANLPVVDQLVNRITHDQEAFALVNTSVAKVKQTLLDKNRSKAVEWLYSSTDKVPKTVAAEYVDFIVENVDPKFQLLLLAVIQTESRGDPFALSKRGAVGITQIIPKYWEAELIAQGLITEKRDLFDYRTNILCSQYVLKQMVKNSGSIHAALVKYGCNKAYSNAVLKKMNNIQRKLTK